MLRNVKVKTYIDNKIQEKEDELIAKENEVLKHLTAVLRGESESEVVVVEGNGDGYSSATTITKRPDEREKLKAAELLGKRYGLFVDKKDIDASVNTEIKVTLDD